MSGECMGWRMEMCALKSPLYFSHKGTIAGHSPRCTRTLSAAAHSPMCAAGCVTSSASWCGHVSAGPVAACCLDLDLTVAWLISCCHAAAAACSRTPPKADCLSTVSPEGLEGPDSSFICSQSRESGRQTSTATPNRHHRYCESASAKHVLSERDQLPACECAASCEWLL